MGTQTLPEFILNSVALGFIFDIDEMVYAAFTAKSKKRYLRAIGSVDVKTPEWLNRNLDLYWELLGVLQLIVLVIMAYVIYLNDFATELRNKAFCTVCKDFVRDERCAT